MCIYMQFITLSHAIKNPERGLPTNKKKKSKLWYKITNILDLKQLYRWRNIGEDRK